MNHIHSIIISNHVADINLILYIVFCLLLLLSFIIFYSPNSFSYRGSYFKLQCFPSRHYNHYNTAMVAKYPFSKCATFARAVLGPCTLFLLSFCVEKVTACVSSLIGTFWPTGHFTISNKICWGSNLSELNRLPRLHADEIYSKNMNRNGMFWMVSNEPFFTKGVRSWGSRKRGLWWGIRPGIHEQSGWPFFLLNDEQVVATTYRGWAPTS